MTSHLYFSQGFPELQKNEHIIKIREAMRFKRIVEESVREEITEYKREYKESKEESRQKSTLFITLLGVRRKEYA